GNTLEEIAVEKAGIIKKGIPVVIGETQSETKKVFNEIASERNSEIIFAEDMEAVTSLYTSDLKGDYQLKNIRTVITAIEQLQRNGPFNISGENLKNGLLKVKSYTGLKGRWEILQNEPKVICDTAHNAEGLQYVMKQLSNEQFHNIHMVIGVVNDKDLSKILPLF